MLAAIDGTSNAAIARDLSVSVDTVRKWRRRFCIGRVDGLRDLKRSGRPRQFTAVAAAWVKVLARALPAEMGVPLARWSHRELAAEAVTRKVVDSVSVSTVRRWLHADAIKPWQCRSWILPRDPDFAVKVGRVLDLYDRMLWSDMASLRFTDAATNALILGPVGVGKTHLATALGHSAIRRHLSVLYSRADKLFTRLRAARLDTPSTPKYAASPPSTC